MNTVQFLNFVELSSHSLSYMDFLVYLAIRLLVLKNFPLKYSLNPPSPFKYTLHSIFSEILQLVDVFISEVLRHESILDFMISLPAFSTRPFFLERLNILVINL